MTDVAYKTSSWYTERRHEHPPATTAERAREETHVVLTQECGHCYHRHRCITDYNCLDIKYFECDFGYMGRHHHGSSYCSRFRVHLRFSLPFAFALRNTWAIQNSFLFIAITGPSRFIILS